MLTERRILVMTALASLVLWTGDAVVDAGLFGRDSFSEEVLSPDLHELYFRLVAVAILCAGGIIWSRQVRRVEGAINAAAALRADSLTLVAAYPECVIVHDTENPLFANGPALAFFGHQDVAGLQGTAIPDLVHPDDLPLVRRRMASMRQEGDATEQMELRLRREGGGYAVVLIQSRLIRYLGRTAMMTMFRDVTAEVETRRDLLASRERLSLALEAAQDGVWDWDIPSGRMVYSRSWAEMLGLELEDISPDQKTWEGLIHPDDHRRAMALLHAHLQGEVPVYETEVRLRHARGHYIWVLDRGKVVRRNEAGEPLRMAGTHRDITDRKEAELALEIRNRLAETFLTSVGPDIYRGVLELICGSLASPAGMLGTFDHDGDLVVVASLPAGRAMRIPAGALPQLLDRVTRLNHAVIDDGESDIDGSGRRVHGAVAVPISTRDKVLGVVVAADRSDPYRVSDRAFLESLAGYLAPILQSHLANALTEVQLRQAQKMEALGALAGGIAHDFNNILQAILGFTTLARGDAEDGSVLARDLDRVLRSARRGEELVRRILLFSRREEREAIPRDVADLLGEAADLLRPTLPSAIELVVDIAPDTGRILADASQFGQMVLNLATNALHAMENGGGTLTITSRHAAAGTQRGLPAQLMKRDLAVLHVADTGCGMDQRTMSRLFDPFFTTKEVGKGTGLGLSVVHGIVTSHGGHIAFESAPGSGTVATIWLPSLDAAPAPVQTDAAPRVLFVDDEEPIVAVGRAMLERTGVDAVGCVGGAAALELLDAGADRYDILVTDAAMPEIDGSDVISRWQELRPGAPVVVVTGNEGSPLVAASAGKGPALLLRKPFTGESLADAVRKGLAAARDWTN